jgi:mycothiol system anti-sigma-R factor
MLSCEQVLQEIWAFLDGELNEADLVHFRQHIELCRSCFSRIEFEKTLRISIRSKTNHICPEKLKQRVQKFLDNF